MTDQPPAEPEPESEQQDVASPAPPVEDRGQAELDPPAVPFIARRSRTRPLIESIFVRLVATAGIVGIGVAVAAILGTQNVQAWIVGLVVSALSVVLAAVLWSSRTL